MQIVEALDGHQAGILLAPAASTPAVDPDELAGLAMVHLRRWGWVVLRGLARDFASYVQLTERMAPAFVPHGGAERVYVGDDKLTSAVDPGTNSLSWHRERAYLPGSPDLLFFWCGQESEHPGPTLLVDGHRIVSALPGRLRRALDGDAIVWRNTLPREYFAFAFGATERRVIELGIAQIAARFSEGEHLEYEFDADGNLAVVYTVPAIAPRSRWRDEPVFCNHMLNRMHHDGWGLGGDERPTQWPRKRDGSPWDAALGLALHTLTNDLGYDHHWRLHDLVIVDQSRVMHARRTLRATTTRQVYLRMGLLPS